MSAGEVEQVWRALSATTCGRIELLAQQLELTPAQLLLHLHALRAAGVAVQFNAQAYLCAPPPAPLIAPRRDWLGVSECIYALDSTQNRAREWFKRSGAARGVVLAEQQSAGRGRAGRVWSSPLGAHLYLTCWWRFKRSLPQMAGLSLLVGLALRRCLQQLGIDTQLKWPNDVLVHGRKLAGVLIELIDQPAGCVALIGIGLNHRMPHANAPDQPWIDLAALAPAVPSRQQVLETLLDTLVILLEQFETQGFASFAAEFDQHHVLAGHTLDRPESALPARVEGVDGQGRLCLRSGDALLRCDAGEIQLPRAQLSVPWRLLIDCGNTRLKWAWSPVSDPAVLLAGPPLALRDEVGQLRPFEEVIDDLQAAVLQLQIDVPPTQIVLASSLGGDRQALQRVLQERFARVVRVVESPPRLGAWVSAYPQPAALGVDRALAMWAVLPQLLPAQRVLLVSLGTAMTLDVLDGQGRHHGGLIAAAPALQRSALAALSARLEVPVDNEPVLSLANLSAAAVANASVWMAVALIEKIARLQQVDALWFSGGALLDVLPWLQLELPIHVQPELALRGLGRA